MALWIRIFFLSFSLSLSFWMGRKMDHFPNPFLSSKKSRTGTENDRILLFLLFFLSFCFFSSVFYPFSFFFSFPFPALEGKWEWEGVGIFPLLFLNSFLFWEKNERINWKKSKEVLLLFPFKFLYFFLLLILLPFSFWERKWREKRIKKFAFWRIIHFYKNIVLFQNSFFGEGNTPKIYILCQKYA